MSYMIFEINNGSVTFKKPIYKGIASCKNNRLKEFKAVDPLRNTTDEDYTDMVADMGDNWGADEAEILLDDDIYFS